MDQAIDRAERYLTTKWAERAAYEREVFHRLIMYAVKALPRPLEYVTPVPGWTGWWLVGEVIRIGDGAAVHEVWIEPATMQVKVRQVRTPPPT